MKKLQEKIGYLTTLSDMCLLTTALQGCQTKETLKKPNITAQDLLSRGFNDKDLSVAIEVSNELERLIRSGRSLSQALVYMRKQGWLQRINEEG